MPFRVGCSHALLARAARTRCSHALLTRPRPLALCLGSPVSGEGYAKTLLAWLALLEPQRKPFVAKYGAFFYEGFRMFYISCAEAFAANEGAEYMCGYYTFVKLAD